MARCAMVQAPARPIPQTRGFVVASPQMGDFSPAAGRSTLAPMGSRPRARQSATRERSSGWAGNPPPAPELLEEVADRVKRLVPVRRRRMDGHRPRVRAPDGPDQGGRDAGTMRAFYRRRTRPTSPTTTAFLAMIQGGQSAAGLALTTQGDLTSSQRYRDIHLPFGLHDELRSSPAAPARSGRWAASAAAATSRSSPRRRSAGSPRSPADLGHGVRTALSRTPHVPIRAALARDARARAPTARSRPRPARPSAGSRRSTRRSRACCRRRCLDRRAPGAGERGRRHAPRGARARADARRRLAADPRRHTAPGQRRGREGRGRA